MPGPRFAELVMGNLGAQAGSIAHNEAGANMHVTDETNSVPADHPGHL